MKTLCLGCMREYEGEFEVCPYCGYVQSSPAKEAYHIFPGALLRERYIVGRVLGFGGFGITYIGFDTKLQHRIAIKEYFPSEFATRMPREIEVRVYTGEKAEQFQAGMEKTLDEARRLAEFRQTPGITQIYDFFEENNTAYIVMELLEGETLKARLKRVGTMSVEEALPIILAVIGALKVVHNKNIIHRDISPDNIYLLNNGEVKLIDFGAARQVTTTHSKSLTVILKMGYAPVEQYQSGGNQGPWTDVYSLAATFYKMITGEKPPEAPERRLRDTLKEPSKMNVSISKDVESAIMNALQVRIEDRTKSAEEFEKELYSQNVKRTVATVQREDTGRWPVWIKVVCIVAGVCLIAVGGLIGTGSIKVSMPTLPEFRKQDNTVWMPSLVNMSQKEAKERVESLGLEFEIGGTQASETIMKGYVLGQQDEEGNPIYPGAEVEPGRVVYVVISSGSGKTRIPDIMWMSEKKGTEILNSYDLIAINVEEDTDTWAPKGIITSVFPDVQEEIDLEDVITVRVASGTDSEEGTTEVPMIIGMNTNDAFQILKTAGLFMEKTENMYDRNIPSGMIIKQVPAVGEKIQKGDIVEIVVSMGARQVQIVDVVNQDAEEARKNLEELGLAVKLKEAYSNNIEAGRVMAQSLEPGIVDEGTEVLLTVSAGQEPVEAQTERSVPNRIRTEGDGTRETQLPVTQPPETQPPETQPPETQPPETQPYADPRRDPAFDRLN